MTLVEMFPTDISHIQPQVQQEFLLLMRLVSNRCSRERLATWAKKFMAALIPLMRMLPGWRLAKRWPFSKPGSATGEEFRSLKKHLRTVPTAGFLTNPLNIGVLLLCYARWLLDLCLGRS